MPSTLDTREQMSDRMLACYTAGQAMAPSAPEPEIGANFYIELGKALHGKLPERQSDLIGKIDRFRSRGFHAVREQEYALAEQCFARVLAFIEHPELSEESRLICRTFLLQSASYLDYCRGDHAEARRKTLEGLHADDLLENHHGYRILLVHRLQLAFNLVRLAARTGRYGRAVALACRILVFLSAQPLALPLPGQWQASHLVGLPQELLAKLCRQVVSELASVLVVAEPEIGRRVGEPWLARMLTQQHCPRACTWLSLKWALLAGDDRTFLQLGLEYLRFGRSELPLLWYATVLDILTCAERLHLPDGQELLARVQCDAQSWQDLPKHWRLPFQRT